MNHQEKEEGKDRQRHRGEGDEGGGKREGQERGERGEGKEEGGREEGGGGVGRGELAQTGRPETTSRPAA